MKLRFFPRDNRFFDMFNQQVRKVIEGARVLKEMIEKFEDVESMAKIKFIEEDGDRITHRIVEKLNIRFVTPN